MSQSVGPVLRTCCQEAVRAELSLGILGAWLVFVLVLYSLVLREGAVKAVLQCPFPVDGGAPTAALTMRAASWVMRVRTESGKADTPCRFSL